MLLGDSTIDSKVCQEASVGNVLRQYIRESHVVGECKRILSLWLVLVLTIKEEMVSHVQQNISMIISMFLSPLLCALDI